MCYFWNGKSFLVPNLVVSEYVDQTPPLKSLSLLKIKIKQNPGIQKMEYNVQLDPSEYQGLF